MTSDYRVNRIVPLDAPDTLQNQISSTPFVGQIDEWRNIVRNIMQKKDSRLLAIVGPCSIHDVKSCYEYATRLKSLHDKLKDRIFIVMRIYFEKPRTTVGWKGLIYDPYLDDSCNINEGLLMARQFLYQVTSLGLPCGCEFLDSIVPQYIADFVTWGAIGARTVESQLHRQLASGLSMPVGFKNRTDGNVQVAVDGIRSARCPHSFPGIDERGCPAIVHTNGNPDTHVILRGGKTPNYYKENILAAIKNLEDDSLEPIVMVDCSHGNSEKKYQNQPKVLREIIGSPVFGFMLESHLKSGRQDIGQKMEYGKSITDECLGWEETESLLNEIYNKLGEK